MAREFWTQDLRKVMYARLHMEFGPMSSWAGKRSPLDDKERYAAVLKELADYFTETVGEEVTAGAVESQVAYGLTAQREYKDRSLVRNFILNKAAALEVGFITSAGLPNYLNARRDDA